MTVIKKIGLVFTAVLTLALNPLAAKDQIAKVLMVISSNGKDGGKTAPGYEFDEFSSAYLVFKQNGIGVDVASPIGGKMEADAFNPETPNNAKVLADPIAMDKLENSIPLSDVVANNYQAVFVVGGKGAMFDFHDNTDLQQLIAEIYTKGGVVSAVCHGPAALVNVKLPSGDYLVAGKRVNGFTNSEEAIFGKKWMKDFSFSLEDKLISRGGKFQSSPMMLSHLAQEDRLITGQNPSSTAVVAEAVVRSLGLTPTAREKGKDEITLELVQNILDHGVGAAKPYVDNKAAYNGPLIAMYGYYYSMGVSSTADLKMAIDIMNIKTEMVNHPTLRLQVAKSWHKLGDKSQALAEANALLLQKPDFKNAIDFVASLEAE